MRKYFKNSHHQISTEANAYANGRVAAIGGKKNLTDNPHKLGTSLHNAWESGWLIYQAEKLKL